MTWQRSQDEWGVPNGPLSGCCSNREISSRCFCGRESDMNSGTLDLQAFELSDFVKAYENARDRGGKAALEEFLPPADHSLYLPTLRELVCIDLEYGWKRNCPRPLETYVASFPALRRDEAVLQEVAYQEFRCRQEAGDNPSAAEYQQRFGVDASGWLGELNFT